MGTLPQTKETDQVQEDQEGLTEILLGLLNDLRPTQRLSFCSNMILYFSTWRGSTQVILQELGWLEPTKCT